MAAKCKLNYIYVFLLVTWTFVLINISQGIFKRGQNCPNTVFKPVITPGSTTKANNPFGYHFVSSIFISFCKYVLRLQTISDQQALKIKIRSCQESNPGPLGHDPTVLTLEHHNSPT